MDSLVEFRCQAAFHPFQYRRQSVRGGELFGCRSWSAGEVRADCLKRRSENIRRLYIRHTLRFEPAVQSRPRHDQGNRPVRRALALASGVHHPNKIGAKVRRRGRTESSATSSLRRRESDDIARVKLRKRWRDEGLKSEVKTRTFSAQTAEKIRHPAGFNRDWVYSGAARKGSPPATPRVSIVQGFTPVPRGSVRHPPPREFQSCKDSLGAARKGSPPVHPPFI